MKHPKNMQIRISDTCSIDLVLVEGGDFLMGSENGPVNERPVHEVRVGSFYIGKYPVTQAQWQEIIGNNPVGFKIANRPVNGMCWLEVQNFLKQLNGKTEKQFRLPTESEWEFAARGGSYNEGYRYAGSDKLKQVGWYSENSNGQTQEVGQLLANELGLCGMSGNVWEWCEDDWHFNYKGAPLDGSAWIDMSVSVRSSWRVLRGGSYFLNAGFCRPASRNSNTSDGQDSSIGFRLVLPL